MLNPLNLASSLFATALRGGAGVSATPARQQPEQLLQLYDFEGCPHCRLVREVLTELDLDALILPCPKGGQRFRPDVIERGGKAQFPFLVDPNTGRQMYESADIVEYLFQTYGRCDPPWRWRFIELQRLGSVTATLPRLGLGVSRRPATAPDQPLELYSFESSPFARPVREWLCEHEIAYVLRSVGRTEFSDWLPPELRRALNVAATPRTRNRSALLARAGAISIPYLIDPNTGSQMPESAAIIAYLRNTYVENFTN